MFSRSGRERGISLPQRPNFPPTLLRSARKSKSLRTTTQLRPPATHAFSVDSTLLKFAISANNTFLRVCALFAKCRGVCPESETLAKPCGTGFSSPLTPVVSALTDVQIPRDLKSSRINTYAKPPGVRLSPRIGLQRAWANGTMARTLVIQLGRLGDVIQTTPLLADLDATGDEVDVLVLRSAHEPLIGFSAVANIITIPDSLKPLDDVIALRLPERQNSHRSPRTSRRPSTHPLRPHHQRVARPARLLARRRDPLQQSLRSLRRRNPRSRMPLPGPQLLPRGSAPIPRAESLQRRRSTSRRLTEPRHQTSSLASTRTDPPIFRSHFRLVVKSR